MFSLDFRFELETGSLSDVSECVTAKRGRREQVGGGRRVSGGLSGSGRFEKLRRIWDRSQAYIV